MSRKATIVQVFVASPSDVQPERDLLDALIVELNRTWSTTLGVMFELLKWETHVHPSFGADPQSIVNEQIGDSYDVFIGILWGRFGTPTPRAQSGTAEEFERAFSRLKGDRHNPEVMIYFKDAPLPPSKIDPAQLQLIQNFRASLPDRGGIYAVFEDESGFQSSLRAHLAALAQKWSSMNTASNSAEPLIPAITEDAIADDHDDLGYLDYVESYESRMAEMTSTLTVISNATIRIGEQISQRTKEIQQLGDPPPDIKTARRLVKKAADDMDAYAEILNNQIPLMSSSRESALHALTSALTLYEDFSNTNQSDLAILRTELTALLDAATGSKEGIAGLYSSTAGLPRMTSDLNRAKRAVLGQLDSLLAEIDKTTHTIENILASIDKILQRV
ncbi:MAG: DUF4062 domain-containing protein [Gallionellaceae bacterium]